MAGELRVLLNRRVFDDPLRLVGHQVADPQALLPGAGIVPFRLLRIARFVEQAVVRRDHASLSPVHENRHAAGQLFQPIAKRADEIGAEIAGFGPQHLGMDRVIDERRHRLPGGRLGTDHAHPLVVELRSVIVVRNFSPRLVGGDFDRAGLQVVDRLVQRRRRLVADEVHVFEVAAVSAAAIGKAVAIRSTVRVGAADEDVVLCNPRHFGPHAVSQDSRKADHVDAHDTDGGRTVFKDNCPHAEIAPLVVHGSPRPDSARDRQERVWRNDADPRSHFDLGSHRRNGEEGTKQNQRRQQ